MTLNSSGPISLAGSTTGQSIAIELGVSATAQISLNDTNVRTLAGVPSGAIIMPTNFYGKSNRAAPSVTLTTNTTNYSLNITTLSGYVAGVSDVLITGDTVKIVNNGFILGMGGSGGGGSMLYYHTYIAGSAGGNALSLGFNTTIDNTNASAYIAGGGGGGGCYIFNYGCCCGLVGSGGGAGGGPAGCFTHFTSGSNLAPSTTPGALGGAVGSTGTSGGYANAGGYTGQFSYMGGGGGRILPGTGGNGGTNVTKGGNGGGSGGGAGSFYVACYGCSPFAINGGAGGSGNAAGSSNNGGGGGGWGAAGGNGSGLGGYAGGKAVALNGKTVTWVSGNTTRVYGAVA